MTLKINKKIKNKIYYFVLLVNIFIVYSKNIYHCEKEKVLLNKAFISHIFVQLNGPPMVHLGPSSHESKKAF